MKICRDMHFHKKERYMKAKPTKVKICIWGAGERGKRIYRHLEPEDILYFVDSAKEKIGSSYLGKEIISVERYVREFSSCFILIAHMEDIKKIEKREKIKIQNYFYLSDCPGELQEPNIRDLLKKYIEGYLNSRIDYALYGITLYTILIDRWIYSLCGLHPPIIPQSGFDQGVLENVKREFPSLKIIRFNEINRRKIKEICNVIYDGLAEPGDILVSDLYDCSDKITEYRNSKITKYKNKHNGQRCVIVATGPSLCACDLDLVEKNKMVSFSVNSVFKIFDQTLWRPTYYVIDDYRAIQKYDDIMQTVSKDAVFIGDTFQKEKNYGRNAYLHHIHYESYLNRLPKFSEDFAQKSYLGYTVVYSCIQLAVYMGFRELYLLGTDCNYVMGSRNNYFWQSKEKDVMNHELDKIMMGYQSAKKYADGHGIKIWNATRGGNLEVFDRIRLEDVFD